MCMYFYEYTVVWMYGAYIVHEYILQQPVMSNNGLLTTVAYQLGPGKPVSYGLEVKYTYIDMYMYTLTRTHVHVHVQTYM